MSGVTRAAELSAELTTALPRALAALQEKQKENDDAAAKLTEREALLTSREAALKAAEAALQTREKAIAAREEAVAARELDVRAVASKNEAALASLKLREEKAAVAAASASVQETAASMLKDASDKAQASLRHAPPPPKRVEMPGCPPMSESLHMQILARATATALLKHQLAAQQKGEPIEAA